jgi:hypothetical protein
MIVSFVSLRAGVRQSPLLRPLLDDLTLGQTKPALSEAFHNRLAARRITSSIDPATQKGQNCRLPTPLSNDFYSANRQLGRRGDRCEQGRWPVAAALTVIGWSGYPVSISGIVPAAGPSASRTRARD